MSLVEQAEARQREALKPEESVWVAASAGTGKTKVLTDRLLVLMLGGADPSRLLCLTFTRAAAAEMANRINAKLAGWTTMPPGQLAQELVALTGRYPRDYEMARARQLFARVLELPGGVKIATIHAFCQSLLRRFPLEAGVPPEFVVIDVRTAKAALAEAAAAVINAARDEGDAAGGLAEALSVVARYAPEERFLELMSAIAAERGKLAAALMNGEEALRRRMCDAFGIAPDVRRDTLTAAFCAPGAADEAGLRAACAALAMGSKTDQERGLVLARWCAEPDGRRDLLDPYIAFFLTEKQAIRQSLITRGAARTSDADVDRILQTEAERVLRFVCERAGVATIEATIALVRLGAALLRAYDRQKQLHGLLDYDDLVRKTLALLRRPDVVPWVLFKLDGGLDHILVDEAQDTNPEQWEIVAALAAEFFAGEGAGARTRTVFAVGDVKQSIYSFQGADPQAFVAMREHFAERVSAARQRWAVVPLEISFRAAAPLLRGVDAVFRNADAADGVSLDGMPIHHVAARAGHAGIVELWPPVPADPPDDRDDPAGPVRRRPEPRTRLAAAIAATIAGWLDRGERLEARGRAIRPGDIMVLVRRRNDFVGDLLRALKQRNVPVAGADRLTLAAEMAVRDLIALGHFLLLPEDDLTLATVLKGPLFGLSEDDLFLLAQNRGNAKLWDRLRAFAAKDLMMRDAAERLRALLARADFVPPFELYAEVLSAGGGRRAMLERLGPEAADPIEEFLALALAYERDHVPSLQGFLRWLVAEELEVKRDFGERLRDEVRILTVHGAKGLEAPVVFLPDTMQLPENRVNLLWSEPEGLPLWRPQAGLTAPFYSAQRAALRRRHLQEYRRLLYVALTRAEDRLYVCGWQTQKPTREAPCWHTLCLTGWEGIAERFDYDARHLLGEEDGWSGQGLRIRGIQESAPRYETVPAGARAAGERPAWAHRPPPPEPTPPRPLLPSRPSGPEPATLSPLSLSGRDRFKRGLLVHRLLQSLPELPADQRESAVKHYLALPAHRLGADEQDEICGEVMGVLRDPRLTDLWGPDSRAEVPVVGLIPGAAPGTEHALSGQIDRLVATPQRVLIVDFKTVRPAPASEEAVPAVYLRQLATYRAALERIYPDRPVDCAILWTDGPLLMPISSDLLAAHLPGALLSSPQG